MEMGFNREAARQALMDNNNNLEVALNSLLTGSSGSRPGPAAAESNKPQPRGIHTNTHTAPDAPLAHFGRITIYVCRASRARLRLEE